MLPFKCQPTDLDFFENAPVRLIREVELNASASEVFTLFENGEAWPLWFKDMKSVNWTSPKPFKVGTTRVVTFKMYMGCYALDEYFFRWEDNVRFSFYGVAQSLPFAKTVAEDYHLIPLGDDRCKFVYTICAEPGPVWIASCGLAEIFFKNVQKRACLNLAKYIG